MTDTVTSRPLTVEDAAPQSRREAYLVPIVVFVLSRAFLAALAHSARHLLAPARNSPSYLPRTDPLAGAWDWTSPWFRFDARWYVDVAEHGYRYGAIAATNTNFFPLYPLLIRVFQPLTLGSPWFAGLLVANAAFLAALILLWKWAAQRWNPRVALRVMLLTVAFPFAFFYAAPYSEPLFLALAVAAFLLGEQGRWRLAVCAAGLCAITRPVGVAVVVALVILALRRRRPREAALAALGILPFAAFVLYLWITFGHPLAFAVNHSVSWVPPHGGLLATIESQFHTTLSPFDRVDAVVAAMFLVSLPLVWRRVGPAAAAYAALGVLLPLSRGFVSLERYVIVLFPVMAAWATWRNSMVQAGIFCVSLLGLTIATVMFAAGYSLF